MKRNKFALVVVFFALSPIIFLFQNCGKGFQSITAPIEGESLLSSLEPKITVTASPSALINLRSSVIRFSVSGVYSRVTCSFDDGTAAVCNGQYDASAMSDGDHNLKIVVENNGQLVQQTVLRWQVDATKPAVQVNAGPSGVIAVANTSMTFTGTDALSGISRYECAIGANGAFGPCASPRDFSAMTQGTDYVFRVQAVDRAGNVSDVVIRSWRVDLSAPIITISNGPANVSNLRTASFIFSGTDDGVAIANFQCSLGTPAGPGAFAACASPMTYNDVADGSRTFYLQGLDSAGVYSSPTARTWMVDATAPTVSIVSYPTTTTEQTSATFQFNGMDGTGSGIVRYECSLDNAAFTLCTSPLALTGLPVGGRNFRVQAVDNATNTSAIATYNWTIHEPVINPTVSVGYAHSCGIINGALKCWGYNGYGQIGDGTVMTRVSPVTVISSGVTAVSSGNWHTCAIVNGALQCWGSNGRGQIGNGSIANQLSPVTVIASGVTSVAAASDKTCAVASGSLYCWGDGGQDRPTFARISGGVTAVAIGREHTCAVVGGALRCWGLNRNGQLGVPIDSVPFLGQVDPITVIPSGVTAVAAGAYHTCAIVRGALQCWGDGTFHQVGNSFPTFQNPNPLEVISSGVSFVTARKDSTCAVVNGTLRCWGKNDFGQLGNGTYSTQSTPATVIPGGVTSVALGDEHTCALVSGTAQCWGNRDNNRYGQLGSADPGTFPFPKIVNQNAVATPVSGNFHSCIVEGGALRCWGENNYGQVGNGSLVFQPTPVTVIASGVTSVAAASDKTCAIVNTSLQCWGGGGLYGIGNGVDRGYSATPVTIIQSGVTAVSIGLNSGCAIVNGALQCWGDTRFGLITGNGTSGTSAQLTPATVISAGVTGVAVGRYHVCAIVNGGLRCWGNNTDGQIGNGQVNSVVIAPFTTVIASDVTSVSAGLRDTCALSNGALSCWGSGNGTPTTVIQAGVSSFGLGGLHTCAIVNGGIQCWGYNNYGQIGNGTYVDQMGLFTVLASGVTEMTVNNSGACALVSGALQCWGLNMKRVVQILPGPVVGF